MEYLIVKLLHVLSSTVLFGAGVGSAFHLFTASMRREITGIATATRTVVLADWLLTTPTAILQPLTGFYLLKISGLPMTVRWIQWSAVLYAVAILCWLPVLYLQIRMRNLAAEGLRRGHGVPQGYWLLFRYWVALGTVALVAFLAIFCLMVLKPP